jgi:hypothetical protein
MIVYCIVKEKRDWLYRQSKRLIYYTIHIACLACLACQHSLLRQQHLTNTHSRLHLHINLLQQRMLFLFFSQDKLFTGTAPGVPHFLEFPGGCFVDPPLHPLTHKVTIYPLRSLLHNFFGSYDIFFIFVYLKINAYIIGI